MRLLNAVYTPSPTENSPISDKEKLPLKIKTLVAMGGLFIVMLVIGDNTYRNIILIATVFEHCIFYQWLAKFLVSKETNIQNSILKTANKCTILFPWRHSL